MREALGLPFGASDADIVAEAQRFAQGGGDATTLRAENERLKTELAETQRTHAVSAAVTAEGGNPALLVPYVRANARYGDGGKVTLGGKEFAGLGDAVKSLRDNPEVAGAFAHRYAGNSGAITPSGDLHPHAVRGSGKPQPSRGRMTAAERVNYIREHGGDAYKALPQ